MGMRDMLKIAMHGRCTFPEGTAVTVREVCLGMHDVDIGMSSYTVAFPLRPGDRMTYGGPHLHAAEIVIVSIDLARELVRRITDESRRRLAGRYLDLREQDCAGVLPRLDLRIPVGVLQELANAG